jgi:hypothetical protein
VSSSYARVSALLLSLGLTFLSQLPVITAEHHDLAGEHPAAIQSVGTTSETSTIYDADEHLWKRWSMESGEAGRVVSLCTSTDGALWNEAAQPCFTPASGTVAWDHSSIASPIVIQNEHAAPERRYMMWYSGACDSTAGSGASATTSIGLAFSADGRTFTRLPASESPCGVEGLVFSGDSAFEGNRAIVQGSVGEPRITLIEGKYTMSFFRVGSNLSGIVEAAGLAHATSEDGIKWTMQTGEPVTVELVGKTTRTPALVHRLRQLVDAYSECPM